MTWKTLILTASLLLSLAQASDQTQYTKVDITTLPSKLKESDLSLVIFGNPETQISQFQKMNLQGALKLLGKDLKKLKIFQTSAKDNKSAQETYSVSATEEPALRMFWKGIMMPLPTSKNFRGMLIYRWIRMHIRAARIPKVEILDTETFFEVKKEQHPYIVIGLGDKTSVEGSFLGEFSMIPRTSFKMYMLEDKQARRVFQSQGLSPSKYNILFINNVAKKMVEYTGDLDYYRFNQFLTENARQTGVFPFKRRTSFLTDSIALKKNVVVLFPPKNKKKFSKRKFVNSIRRVAERLDHDIYWGEQSSEYLDEVDFSDCSKNSKKICGYILQNFWNTQQQKRYKVEFKRFNEDTLEEQLGNRIKNLGAPYYFSDSSAPVNLKTTGIQVLSRNNKLEKIDKSGKDSLILTYSICGSNCQEKLKYLVEARERLSEESLKNLEFYVCDLRKNEMGDEFYEHQNLSLFYVRKTDVEKLIHLKEVSSGFDLLEAVKKLATVDMVDNNQEDEEFEDYI